MDPKLKKKISAVTAKRPRTVLDHLLKHGSITSAELKDIYGYNHPPRAIRDVREHGIPIKTLRQPGPDGRQIAVYTIDEGTPTESGKRGRRGLPKALKRKLLERDGPTCALCGAHTELQIDHRIPYEIGGEVDDEDVDAFMLVCRPCNRAKSWSCEHCPNWTAKDVETCATCLWAGPSSFQHVATEVKRRVDIVWEGREEVADYDALAARHEDVRGMIKELVRRALRDRTED